VSDPTAVSSRVMAMMAVLAPAGVGRELLHVAGHMGALASDRQRLPAAEVDRALERLAERSLLDFSLDDRTVIVHRLVTRVVREALARYGQLTLACRVAAWVLEAHADALASSHDRPGLRDVLEQVAALVDVTARLPVTDKELADAVLRLRFLALSHLIEQGDSAQAVALGQQLTAELERTLGRDHHDTLKARDNLATAYQSAGLPMAAIAMFELTLGARDRTLGPDHTDTIRSQDHLAAAYRTAGDIARAIPLAEQILATQERLLGADHPGTLRARNNLAQAHLEAGRAAEAIALFEQNLTACERVLGPDHPRTLSTRNRLALARREVGGAE
jgi:tetratricopeptide (TPR) repeat protein